MTISKHIPKRRFKEFVSEDGWVSSKFLDNISQIIDFRGRTPKKLGMDWSKEGYLALSALNVKNGYIDRTVESHFGDEELYNKWMSGKELQKNQVIFTTEAPMGNVAQIPDENKYILSQRTIAFKVNDSKIIDDFLAVLLRSKSTFDSLLSLTSGGTAKGVSQKSLEELSVFIPNNLKEQTKIGSFLKQLDQCITLHQHKLDKLKNLKKSYLAEIFPAEGERVPKRRFPGFEGEWEERRLGEITTYRNGIGHEEKQSSFGKYELVNLNSISIDGGLKSSGRFIEEASETLMKNDLVMVLSDVAHGDLLGRVAIIPENDKFVLNQRVALLRHNGSVDTKYLFSFINAHQKYFKLQGAGSSQLNLSRYSVENFEVVLPCIEEQKIIGVFFQKLDNSITFQQQKLDKLKDLKKAYLNELFV